MTLLPPPAAVFLLELSLWTGLWGQTGLCLCVCVWESEWERERNVVRVVGGKGITRVVFVSGTGPSLLARTYTYKHAHTLAKNSGLLWTPSPVGSTHYSHTLYHPLPLCLFLSLIFLSLYLSQITLVFLPQLLPFTFNLVSLQFLTLSWLHVHTLPVHSTHGSQSLPLFPSFHLSTSLSSGHAFPL